MTRAGTLVLAGVLAAGVLAAGVEADYYRARTLAAGGDFAAGVSLLQKITEADPEFYRAWEALAEIHANAGRLAEFKAWVSASKNRGACQGRMEVLLLEKASPQAFESEARTCAGILPDSFTVYIQWISRVSWPLAEEFAARAAASPQSMALQFAAGFASRGNPTAMRQKLMSIPLAGLSSENANELDNALTLDTNAAPLVRKQILERMLARARASGDADWSYRVAGRLSILAQGEGRYAEALALAREARAGAEKVDRQTYVYDGGAGNALFRLGRVREAIDAFQQAYADAVRRKNVSYQAQMLGWLSDQHNEAGHHAAAVDFALRALDAARTAKLTEVSADQHINLAFAWLALGQGPRALDALREGLTLVQAPARNWHARILNDAGQIYLRLGQPALAQSTVNRSLAMEPATVLQRAEGHLLRAESGLSARRFQEVEQDLAAAEKLAPEVPSYRARAGLTAGQMALSQSRYAEAFTAFAEARNRAAGFPHLLVQAHAGLSDVHWRQGRLAEALAERQQAIEIIERLRALLVAEHRAGFLASRVALYRDSAQLLLRLNRVGDAFVMAERGRARALLDMMQAPPAPAEPTEALTVRSAMAATTAARNASERRQADLQLQIAMDRYLTSLGGAGQTAPLATLAGIQQSIPAGTLVLHYTLGQQQSSLFAVQRHRVRHFVLGSGPSLEVAVRPARALLALPPSRLTTVQLLERLRALHRMLLGPVAAELAGIRELVVVADGVLHTLPFEALVEGDASALPTAPFLVRRFAVRYAPSAALTATASSRDAAAPLLLAYGDPNSADGAAALRTGAGPFRRLPFSREEVQRVAALYPAGQRRVVLGDAAGEHAFKADPALTDADVIHLAVHGFVDDQWPLMSGLVLPEDTRTGATEDGILRIYEILALRLRARLVVLSACDSGSGVDVTGEGVSSLRRAFLAAGAHSIVASLWQVDDRATADLMTAFHRQLRGNRQSPTQALRAAQLQMLASGLAHPYYWSVFTLMSSASR